MSRQISREELVKHSSVEDGWIQVGDSVYDVTKFLSVHPGGKHVMLNYLGKDATQIFNYFHQETLLKKYEKLKIGSLIDEKRAGSEIKVRKQIPYGEPYFLQQWYSPYHTEEHFRLKDAIRKYIQEEIEPFYEQWEDQTGEAINREVIKKCASQGWLALCLGFWPTEFYPEKKVCGIELKNPDMFHESILYDELSRLGSAGLQWGITGGLSVGLPPIIKFGSDYLKQKVVRACLQGEKTICLAITEPEAGSDVAGIQTTAKKSECGKFYIVNGVKKWITNGLFSDFFTTAVRTGGKGMGGISLLLIEKGMKGVSTRQMKCQGMQYSKTTMVIFENVQVPVENLIGNEGRGFNYIVVNFNHERLLMANQGISLARTCVEECMKFSHRRKTFGKTLIEHPVIRLKLAHMVRQVESSYALLQQTIYNYNQLPQQQIGGSIALLKVQASQILDYCAREAIQIFGGLGYTKGGLGSKVERIYREVKFIAVPGGSEEILLDLGIRQGSKLMPNL